jgi:hypothetical protein
MKTRVLFTLALLITGSFLFAQSLELSYEGETLEPNATITKSGPVDNEIIADVEVTNIGTQTMDVLCQRYELDMVPNTSSAICWGGLCYGPSTSLSPLAYTIDPGSAEMFNGHYQPANNTGVSTIAFTFFDQNNPNDSVMVTIMFDGLTTGINDPVASQEISIYPNPADEHVNVEVQNNNLSNELFVRITDSKGAVVMQETLESSITTLNTRDLSEGLYFMNTYSENKVIASKKILVKH